MCRIGRGRLSSRRRRIQVTRTKFRRIVILARSLTTPFVTVEITACCKMTVKLMMSMVIEVRTIASRSEVEEDGVMNDGDNHCCFATTEIEEIESIADE